MKTLLILFNNIRKIYFLFIIQNIYKDYCSNKCINIVIDQNDKDDTKKAELRGMYKGYLYGMKLFNTLLQRGKSVRNYEIYNHLKYYKSHCTTLYGENKAILDIMNFISINF